MRTLTRATVRVALLSAFAAALKAQQPISAFDGVWRMVESQVVRPDSTVMRPPAQGVSIILHGQYSQIWFPAAPYVVKQASAPSTAEEKAARYDRLTANAGRIELHDSTSILHYEYAKNPAAVGTTSLPVHVRLVGDTMWLTSTSRWTKDTSKVVRTTTRYVREK